jgi:hypothetical protein
VNEEKVAGTKVRGQIRKDLEVLGFTLSKMKSFWKNAYLVCARPWVLAPQKKIKR